MNLILDTTYKHIKEHETSIEVDVLGGKIISHSESYDRDGYLMTNFKGKTIRSHIVIAYYIFGERIIGTQINHIDGNKENNKPYNLELVTPSENVRHAFESGLRSAPKGEDSSASKLTEKQVVEIRALRKEGKTLKEIGDIYGISFQHVSRLCSGKRWGHLPPDLDIELAGLDLDKYQELAKRTANVELTDFDEVVNYALGLVSESAEVSDQIKKELFHGHTPSPDNIEEELGDVMWYMANLANKYGLTLKGIATRNIDKLKKRYPNGFSEYDSINRKE